MNIRKRITAFSVALVLGAGLLFGCGNGGTDNSEKSSAASETGALTTEAAETDGTAEVSENAEVADTTADTNADTTAEQEIAPSLIGSAVVPEVSVKSYEVPDTEAFRFVSDMKIGMSLGNTFDAYNDSGLADEMDSETVWQSMPTSREIIKGIHDAGFETLRIPVSWHQHLGEDFTISEKWLNRVKEVVDWALDEGMYVIINIHHDNHPEADCFYPDYDHLEQSKHYITRIWEQLSDVFKDYDEKLIFESMNEPRLVGHKYEWWIPGNDNDVKESIECINILNQTFVDTVRAGVGKNPERYLMCPGYDASYDGALNKGFVMPADTATDKLIVSVHAYIPYDFALQYPGTDYFDSDTKSCTKEIDSFMDKLYDRFVKGGVPVVIGEFGARDKNNLQDRVDFSAYYIASAKAHGMTALWWDNNAFGGNGENFGLYYRRGGYILYEDILSALMKYADR